MGRATVAGGRTAMAAPSRGILLKDMAEGSVVKISENGTPVEFYVACHNYESALNGAGRTLLVRKSNYGTRTWDDTKNTYADSDIDAWLNGTYKSLLNAKVQAFVGSTKFYYTVGSRDKTVTTLSRGVFLMSVKELGQSGDNANIEGSTLPTASVLNKSGTQWTRTPSNHYPNYAYVLTSSGSLDYFEVTETKSVRPCFTLPANALFDEETLEFKGVA